jgi:hypothetical protein
MLHWLPCVNQSSAWPSNTFAMSLTHPCYERVWGIVERCFLWVFGAVLKSPPFPCRAYSDYELHPLCISFSSACIMCISVALTLSELWGEWWGSMPQNLSLVQRYTCASIHRNNVNGNWHAARDLCWRSSDRLMISLLCMGQHKLQSLQGSAYALDRLRCNTRFPRVFYCVFILELNLGIFELENVLTMSWRLADAQKARDRERCATFRLQRTHLYCTPFYLHPEKYEE